MSVAELQKFTAVSKYARYLADRKRRETWEETAARYAGMLAEKYPHRARQVERLRDEFITPMRVLPSMRGMQFGGPPVFQHSARLFNCTASYVDRLSFFGQAFYLLLCGCGVGYSVQDRHLRSLPDFSAARRAGRVLPKKVYRPADSIEGWASCAHVQLSSYHARPVPGYEEWADCDVEFDLSGIRPKNSPLSFGIGRAPGPMPLGKALKRNRKLLDAAVAAGLTRMTDELASDVHLNNSDAVVSGGVRRSANICIFDLTSERMRNYKTGDWREKREQRARANISAMLVRGRVSWDDFWRLFEATRQFGEPGFWWADDEDYITNPCAEIGLYCRLLLGAGDPRLAALLRDYDGPVLDVEGRTALSGFQFCNLTTINGKTVRAADDLCELAGAAAELGTYQAGFTDFPFVGPISEEITRREALLGVSIAGVMHHPEVMLDPVALRAAAGTARARNEEAAAAIGINPAARITCEKPDGNSASTLGCFSGCHPGKIRRGFRISQVNKIEPPYLHFRTTNAAACEESAWSKNRTDDCVRFCVEYEGVLEEELTAVEFLGHVRTLQAHWVGAGTVPERCVRPGLHHNVSNTAMVRDHEWGAVARYIYDHQADFGGVSFISASGALDYPQAPFTPVYTWRELLDRYGPLGVEAAQGLADGAPAGPSSGLWNWCDIALGLRSADPAALPWVARLRDAAADAFGGDVRKAVLATKSVYNLRLYERLKAAYRPVDWAAMREETSGVDFAGEVACGAGGCET